MSSEASVPPVDADVDLTAPKQRRELREHPATVLAAISCGGALGALARYGLGAAVPHAAGGMAWATLSVNASGCLLIGVLIVLITDAWPGQRLLRPFLGVGLLGGYTTYSTYTVDIQQAIAAGAARTALAYLGITLALSLFAVWAKALVTRALLRLGHDTRRRA